MKYILFDDDRCEGLFPLTLTRSAADLRTGILTLREKWTRRLNTEFYTRSLDIASAKYEAIPAGEYIFINSRWVANDQDAEVISNLAENDILTHQETVLAFRGTHDAELPDSSSSTKTLPDVTMINMAPDLFRLAGSELEHDFELVTKGRTSQPLSQSNNVIGDGSIFIEEGAKVEGAILNASNGPIYVGKNAEIMEGSIVRGGLALCEHSALKLGTKLYGPCTIGPHSKVGGELNNSVIIGYSNKGHDGFVGNSVIGEWCNLGADTNTSNLKNNYAEVRIWDYNSQRFKPTGLQFCGLIMGDHSKCGINTMFNTGTVVGVSANIFGSGFPRNFVPSFAWGGASGFSTYKLNKVFEVAEIVMGRRDKELDDAEKETLSKVFEHTASFRFWDKKS